MAQSDDFFGQSLTYEQIQELLPGFALGALDAHEMQAIERYLQQHERLLQDRYNLELSSQALAYSAPPRPLPASLKARVMERVRADVLGVKGLQGERRAPFSLNASVAPVQPRAAVRPQRRGTMPIFPEQGHNRSAWQGIYQSLVGLAAVAATAILLIANWQLNTTSEALNQQVGAIQEQLAVAQADLQQAQGALDLAQTQSEQTNTQLASMQTQLQQAQRDAAELETVNNALQQTVQQQASDISLLTTANRLLILAGLDGAQQANGTFIISNDEVILTVRGLPPLPTDKTYQLWYLTEGVDPEPADLFQVQQSDATRVKLRIPADITTFANIGITIEPAGGSLTPTELVLLSTT